MTAPQSDAPKVRGRRSARAAIRLAAIAACLLLVGGAILALAPLLVPMQLVKQAVTEKVTEWSGRPIGLAADPKLSLFPFLRFQLDGLTIGNRPEMDEGPFLTVKSLRGSLKLLPLLFGRIEFSEFSLTQPHLFLAIDAQRRNNWSTPLTPTRGSQSEKTSVSPQAVPGALGRLIVREGAVSYANAGTGEHFEFSSVDATIDWEAFDGAIFLDGGFIWNGERVSAKGSLTQPLQLMEGGISPLKITIASEPIRIAFAGEASRVSDLQVDGDASISTPALRRLAGWLGGPLPQGVTLGSASIRGKANWLANSILFANARFELDGNQGDGVLTLRVGTGKLGIAGTLAFDRLDLTPYFDFSREGERQGESWLAAKIDPTLLRQVNLDLRLSASQLVLGAARIGPAGASLVLSGDRLAINAADTKFHGGVLQASLDADVGGDAPSGTVRLRATDISLKPALTELSGIGALDGKASGNVEFSGRGASWGDLLRSIAGTARLSIADATLAGLDLATAAPLLREAQEGVSLPLGRGSASFKSLTADLTIAAGTLATRNLRAQAPNALISLDGSASLLSSDIKGSGTLTLSSLDQGKAGIDLPFLVGGSWSRPSLLADTERKLAPAAIPAQ